MNKILFGLIIIILLIPSLIFLGCFGIDDNNNDTSFQFSSIQGYKTALTTAKEWRNDAFLVEVYSKDGRNLDGKNDHWWYDFYSPSTITNNTDYNEKFPWVIERFQVKIIKENNQFKINSQITTNLIGSINLTSRVSNLLEIKDSNEIAQITSNTKDVKNLLNKTNSICVDYRLTEQGWIINVDSLEHDAYRDGIAVVVKIDPETEKISSYTEDGTAD